MTTMFVEEVTGDAGDSVDSRYGDSLEDAALADVIGASLVRTVCIAWCGGFVLGWLPGLLLLEVLEFNTSLFCLDSAEQQFAWWASPAAQVLQLGALLALVVWRWSIDGMNLAQAQARLMVVDAAADEDAREEVVKEVMVAVGWSYFVQGGLACWVFISELTARRVGALSLGIVAWLVLDSLDLAPFSAEVWLARLLPAPAPAAVAAPPASSGRSSEGKPKNKPKASGRTSLAVVGASDVS